MTIFGVAVGWVVAALWQMLMHWLPWLHLIGKHVNRHKLVAYTLGVLGIVLPGTLMGDQASVSMRRHALCKSELLHIAAYPPEARLFAKVDQPVVAATFRASIPASDSRATLRLHAADRAREAFDPDVV